MACPTIQYASYIVHAENTTSTFKITVVWKDPSAQHGHDGTVQSMNELILAPKFRLTINSSSSHGRRIPDLQESRELSGS